MKRFGLVIFFVIFAAPLLAAEKSFIFTVDLNKLLRATDFGKNIISVNNAERISLQNENEKLKEDLLIEEKELSELRQILPVSEFRPKAVEFDKRVSIIRSEQGRKEQMVIAKARKAEANFFKQIYPLLYELLSDRGGLLLIDQRNVVLWDSSVDLTDESIDLINHVLGNGIQENISKFE
tara:strand:- start:766 stop:1305 length:540 start_codon:yes stop_codon:yes gene_type:complete